MVNLAIIAIGLLTAATAVYMMPTRDAKFDWTNSHSNHQLVLSDIQKTQVIVRCMPREEGGKITERCMTILVNIPWYLEPGCHIARKGCMW